MHLRARAPDDRRLAAVRYLPDRTRTHSGTDTKRTLPDITAEFEGRIARHNALAKERYIERLLTIDPKHFEELVGKLAVAMGYQQVKVQGGAGDGGVDVTGTKIDEWGKAVAAVLQVKRYAKPINRRIVHEMIGVLATPADLAPTPDDLSCVLPPERDLAWRQ